MPTRHPAGLGPRGFAEIRSAAEVHQRIQNGPVGNPSALSIDETPAEAKNEPDYWLPFSSTRVSEAGYDAPSQRLFVRWVKPGPGYIYEGVPQNVWRNMRRAKSAGQFVNRILNSYDYHPMSGG